MQTILVLNPKGGSGKSTIAINLAGFFACWGVRVTIADFDAQATALDWLTARPDSCPRVSGTAIQNNQIQTDWQCDYLLLDVPSGHYGDELLPWINQADKILVPVVPSPHDIRATQRFMNWLATDDRVKSERIDIGIVANRVRENTRSFKLLKSFLSTVHVPCVGILRDTQNYVLAAQHGLSMFELPVSRVKRDLEQWRALIKWLCVDPFINPDVPVKPDESVYKAIYQ